MGCVERLIEGKSMSLKIKHLEYYNVIVNDHASGGSQLLSTIASAGVSLFAYTSVSLGSARTRFTLFPGDGSQMVESTQEAGVKLDGPHPALFVKEEEQDESGDLAGIFEKLSRSNIQVNGSHGIADINGGYGVVLCLKQEDMEKAMAALKK